MSTAQKVEAVTSALESTFGVDNVSQQFAQQCISKFPKMFSGNKVFPSVVKQHFDRRRTQLKELFVMIRSFDNKWNKEEEILKMYELLKQKRDSQKQKKKKSILDKLSISSCMNDIHIHEDCVFLNGVQQTIDSKTSETDRSEMTNDDDSKECMDKVPTFGYLDHYDFMRIHIILIVEQISDRLALWSLSGGDYIYFINETDDFFTYLKMLKTSMRDQDFKHFVLSTYKKYGAKLTKLYDEYIFNHYVEAPPRSMDIDKTVQSTKDTSNTKKARKRKREENQ